MANPREDGFKVLRSGSVAMVEPGGKATLWKCDWLVRVATNNPEPDFPEDCWRDVECGLPRKSLDGTADRTTCDAGHERLTLEEELGPFGAEWQREMAERERGGGW